MLKNKGFAQSELARIGEVALLVAATAGIDYFANHLSLLPFSPVVMAILSPIVLALKFYFDGQKPDA